MRKKRRIQYLTLVLVFIALPFTVYSQTELLDEAMKKLIKSRTFSFEFIQSSAITNMEEVLISEGVFLYQAPQNEGELPRIRLEYNKPKKERQLLVFDGKILWTYRANINQVIKEEVPPEEMKKNAMIFLPQWLEDLFMRYKVQYVKQTKRGLEKFVVVASHPEDNFKKVEFYLEPQSKDLKKYIMIDDNNNILEVEVTTARYDIAINPKKFVFKPAKGAEITENLYSR